MPKTLTIRSDLAWDLAHARAKAEGKSVSKVVEEALAKATEGTSRLGVPIPERAVEATQGPDLDKPPAMDPDWAVRKRRILEAATRFRESLPPDVTSDHSYLYDEHGLPR